MPAAQTLFIMKSTMAPLLRLMNLESWPPISKMVSTSGSMAAAAVGLRGDFVAHHVGANEVPGEVAAGPVVAAPTILTRSAILAPTRRRPSVMASRGRPAVMRYTRARTRPSGSMTTTLVLMEPTSMPR